ncbi:MAG: glycosyltransferase family A protein [Cyanobacteria bacterium J06554_6]
MSFPSLPTVSVVIPAYNAMAYLPEALSSVLCQTFKNYEVIIVNDGSIDQIVEWAAALTDVRIRLLSQENRGLAGARNTGIRESRGRYLAFLDADDCWHPTKLARQVELLEQRPEVGVVYTWMKLINSDGVPTGRTVKNRTEGRIWSQLILRNCVGSGSTPMVRRECFHRVGDFDENLGSYMEDRDMWLRIAPVYDFSVVKEILVDYRQHPASASKNWNAMARSAKIILDKSFNTAPAGFTKEELDLLRKQSYSSINLSLAWKPLQGIVKDYSQSISFAWKAGKIYPPICLSRGYLRLLTTMIVMKLLGDKSYSQATLIVFKIRRQLMQLGQDLEPIA